MVHLTCKRRTNAQDDFDHILKKFFDVGKHTPNVTQSPMDSHTQTVAPEDRHKEVNKIDLYPH